MASDLIVGPKSIQANLAMTSYQFRFVRVVNSSGTGQLALPTNGGLTIGVLQDKPTAQGEPGQVCRPGDITKIVLNYGGTAGDWVMSDANGKAVAAVSGAQVQGQLLDSGSAGDIVRMVYQPLGIYP